MLAAGANVRKCSESGWCCFVSSSPLSSGHSLRGGVALFSEFQYCIVTIAALNRVFGGFDVCYSGWELFLAGGWSVAGG